METKIKNNNIKIKLKELIAQMKGVRVESIKLILTNVVGLVVE